MDKTKVIFRVWTGGNHGVIAFFPEEPADEWGKLCNAYEHIGQHGGADYEGCIARTRPARPAEYADLAKELERIGYHLEVVTRVSPAMRRKRMIEARR